MDGIDDYMRDLGVLRADGTVDLEQLRKEMADYRFMIREVSIVYDNVTGGKLSKPSYDARTVIRAFEEYVSDQVNDAVREQDELDNQGD